MSALRVRVYNVRFGDALLITVPDRNATGDTVDRHILIDVGNVSRGDGGDNAVFRPIVDNLQAVLGQNPLDLYLMTHEHMDHVQGLLFAAREFGWIPAVNHAWLTASAAEDYYDTHPEAKKKFDLARSTYESIDAFFQASPAAAEAIAPMLLNNSPHRTADCVSHLRGLAAQENTHYVHREFEIEGKHPFEEASLEIWGPEEDTTDYYGRFRPLSLDVGGDSSDAAQSAELLRHVPPSGIDAGSFYNLIDRRRRGYTENLLAIDKAANNTSVVLSLEWRGWRLLFPGDAEIRSWKTMAREEQLKPTHFLKVSHHGSHNGTPVDLLEQFLPETSPDDRPRFAVVCTFPDVYSGIPDEGTQQLLSTRCEWKTVEDLPDGGYFDFSFDENGQASVEAFGPGGVPLGD